jgi:hypothetical protein
MKYCNSLLFLKVFTNNCISTKYECASISILPFNTPIYVFILPTRKIFGYIGVFGTSYQYGFLQKLIVGNIHYRAPLITHFIPPIPLAIVFLKKLSTKWL